MSTLPEVYQFLAAGLRADPLLCLAQAVSLFDPVRVDDDDDYTEDGVLNQALRICRHSLPDIYTQAVAALHHGADYGDLNNLICSELLTLGLPLDGLEEMGYGIPLPAYGVELSEPEFYSSNPEVLPILVLFGIEIIEDGGEIDVPQRVYKAADLLSASLLEQSDKRYQQAGQALGWLFSCTGNSSVDYDWESMSEWQPLSWQDDLQFALEISREADEIMTEARAGVEVILANPGLRNALEVNIHRLYRLFKRTKKKEPITYDHLRLYWPPLDGGLAGTAESHPELLQLRGHAA